MGIILAMVLQASTPLAPSAPSYSCDRGGGTLRVNGFSIEIKPQNRGGEDVCHASIRSPHGEIVYEGDNNLGGIDIDPVSGKDINGDGQPDAVLVTDTDSAQFPKTYDDEIQSELNDLKFHKVTIAQDEDDQSSVLSAVFAYLFSGRPGEARKFLDQQWPAADRQSIRKEILSAFCAGPHKDLSLPAPSVCAAGDF